MGFYGARYIVGMFVTGVPIEARYSVINVCNELYLTPVTDMWATPTVIYCLLAGCILEPAKIWQPSGAAS
jgi:hypothetical protein